MSSQTICSLTDIDDDCNELGASVEAENSKVLPNNRLTTEGSQSTPIVISGKRGKARKWLVTSKPYSGIVPDFVVANAALLRQCRSPFECDAIVDARLKFERKVRGTPVQAPPPAPARITDAVVWAVHQAVIEQRTLTVNIPSDRFTQAIWGAGPNPANWRPLVLDALRGFCEMAEASRGSIDVRPGTRFESFFEDYWVQNTQGYHVIDMARGCKHRDPEEAGRIKEAWKEGDHRPVYFPLELFGPSPRVGLSPTQLNILRAVVSELTLPAKRAKYHAFGSPQTIAESKVVSPIGSSLIQCPLLALGASYAGFSGNGRDRSGKGYRLFGARGGGWMGRMGYERNGSDIDQYWDRQRHRLNLDIPDPYFKRLGNELIGSTNGYFVPDVRDMLENLTVLSEPFGLIPAAIHPRSREWKSLSEMQALLGSNRGCGWLNDCHLRIYTPSDFLKRWREYFAQKMGFASIPGGLDADTVITAPPIGTQLRSAMKVNKVTQGQLAKALGITPAAVSYFLSGKKKWTKGFLAGVEAWLKGKTVNQNSLSEPPD